MYQTPGKSYAVEYVRDMAPGITREHYLLTGHKYRVIWWSADGVRVRTIAYYRSKAAAIRRCDQLNQGEDC